MRRFAVVLIVVAGWARPAAAISFEDLLDSYGNLETVAGRAWFPDKEFNGWEEEMEGGSALDAELSRPHMAMADDLGNIYIADKDAHAIRMVTTDGLIHTIAGTSEQGYNFDEGLGTEVQLNQPNGLYTFPDGTTYILDLGNHLVRRLDTSGYLTTVFDDPFGMTVGRGLWVSPDESLVYYSSGTEIRRWTADEGVTTYADGFVELGNLDVDPRDGRVVATDREGYAVYKILDDGSKNRIAGNGIEFGGGTGQLATVTGLKEVRGIYFNPEGGYFLATHDGGQVWFVDDDDIIHLLIDGDDEGTHAGDGLPLTSPGRKISEPRAVTLAPNGDLLITENDAGYIRRVPKLRSTVAGDFNLDKVLDVADLQLLIDEMRLPAPKIRFDLDGDGQVDKQDLRLWVDDLKQTWIGDADLDGEFNSRDFVIVFQAAQYEDDIVGNSSWSTGDWNGDGEFDSGDFVTAFQAGGYEQGPRAATSAVPEPSGWLGLVIGWPLLLRRRT